MTNDPSTAATTDDADDVRLVRWLDAIRANPRAWDFFAVLRRIESLRGDLPRWGRAARPSQEPLRLSQDAELDFAPAALSSLDLAAQPVPRLGVRFFGLFGSQGPMPLHFTEYVRERLRVGNDPTLARFTDIFHHRLLTFFYRAWAEAQPTTQLDRPQDERYSAWLGSGFGFDGTPERSRTLPATAELAQAGLLGSRSRHAEGLRHVLAEHFGVPVDVEQHVPQWLALDDEDRSRLGFSRSRAERFRFDRAALGKTAVAGRKVFDRQYRFRVILGPIGRERYAAFIPGGPAWSALQEWVDHYAGLDLRWDVKLVLARNEVPRACLGRHVRLGVDAWCGAGRTPRDRDDLVLRPRTTRLFHRRSSHA